jgi:hypothetical protein
VRPDEHAVAAGLVGGLDHELPNVLDDVFKLLVVPADVGRHVGNDRVFAKVVLDDPGNVRIDDFVVRDARPRRVGKGDPPCFVDFHETWHTQHRVGAEGQGVEEVIVDPAVEDVDALETFCRPHEHVAVGDDEVAAFHELDAHLLGKEECSK